MDFKNELWSKRSIHWEYSAAATPDLNDIPIEVFPASLHESGESRIIPLDISNHLETDYPATSPALLANYIRICKNEKIKTKTNSSSEIFYVMYGSGHSETEFGSIKWAKGDAFTLPTNSGALHFSVEDSAFAWVHDEPLFSYLRATPTKKCFEPAFYSQEMMFNEVEKIKQINIEKNRNRNGIILGNEANRKTKTITHSMWSLYNLITPNTVQKAHRHQSIAIDLAISADKNTYTLIGKEVDEKGKIINPVKAPWADNTIFITPPGWWHSHHNESDTDAYVFPFQDAGLHTYLRTLDIQFIK